MVSLSQTLEALAGGASLSELIAMDGHVISKLIDQALALARCGKVEEAEALFAKMSVVDRKQPLLPFFLGTTRAAQGKHDGAIVAYSEGLDREIPSEDLRAEVHLQRARSLLCVGRTDEARYDLNVAKSSTIKNVSRQAEAWLSALEEQTSED